MHRLEKPEKAASHLDRINLDRAYPRGDGRLARPAIVRSTEPLHHGHPGSRSTHWARQAGASNGSAKYCVSCVTFPSPNSMILTV